MEISEARKALESLERKFETAKASEAGASRALDAAALLVGDEASAANTAAWKSAREAHELATLTLAGAVRKIESARGELANAERDATRAELAAALEASDRGNLFDLLDDAVHALAEADHALGVDLHAIADGDVEKLGAPYVAKVHAMREIRAGVSAQHAAVATVRAASKVLGERSPAPAEVREDHVLTLAAVESFALRGITDPETAKRAVLELVGGHPPSGLRSADVYLEWARLALVSGDTDRARIATEKKHASAAERVIADSVANHARVYEAEQAEARERARAFQDPESKMPATYSGNVATPSLRGVGVS